MQLQLAVGTEGGISLGGDASKRGYFGSCVSYHAILKFTRKVVLLSPSIVEANYFYK